jgi:hypothetical protein
MPIPSGLSAQLGISEETTYGTPNIPVTRFYEFTDESMDMSIERIESAGLRTGTRVQRSDRWVPGQKSVTGDIQMELANKSFGIWFKHALGAVATTQPDASGNPTVYDHTFTPGDLPVGLTIQVGRTGVDQTTRAFTYSGCRINEWEISGSVGELVTFKASVIGCDEITNITLATASYPTSLSLLSFVQGSLTLAGSAFDIKEFSLTGNNGLADDRYFFGSALRKQPLEASMREYTGELKAEFTDLTAYNRYINGTEAAMVLLFRGATISGTYFYDLQITANVRFDGETPKVGGTEIIEQPLKFKCLGNTSASALTVLYRTTDATP